MREKGNNNNNPTPKSESWNFHFLKQTVAEKENNKTKVSLNSLDVSKYIYFLAGGGQAFS